MAAVMPTLLHYHRTASAATSSTFAHSYRLLRTATTSTAIAADVKVLPPPAHVVCFVPHLMMPGRPWGQHATVRPVRGMHSAV